MAKKNFYAVKAGKTTGIFDNWDECKMSVTGYPGAIYKGFATYDEAKVFLGEGDAGGEKKTEAVKNVPENDTYAFVDGSFNIATKVYGYGGFLVHEGKEYIITGSGDDAEMASMRNVSGEILGCTEAVKKALSLGIKKIDIYYDYEGIKMWAEGRWKRNKAGTIAYYDYMQSVKADIDITFVKVKGHSGVWGNERADALAKKAVGIE
ncbi:MAG: ribonuclease H family protein [Lachnospiraceae bacterium]|nr:ribonuclease H family protein [Lachnospiraceae bacterium]